MSTKGLPVGAACQLAHRFNCEDVRVFVVHDFDLAGFKIVKTLRKGTRLALEAEVIDLGLRLPDVGDLESEPVRYKQAADPKSYLRLCGATTEEAGIPGAGAGLEFLDRRTRRAERHDFGAVHYLASSASWSNKA